MSDLLTGSLAALQSSMQKSFGDMRETIGRLTIEEVEGEPLEEESPSGDSDAEQTAGKRVEPQDRSNEQRGNSSGTAQNNTGQQSGSTVQSITDLINQSSDEKQTASDEIDVLSGIANDVKLEQKKGPW